MYDVEVVGFGQRAKHLRYRAQSVAIPAELLKQTAKGSLDAGTDADLVLLDPTSLDVRACYVGGRLSWADPNLNGAMWYHA